MRSRAHFSSVWKLSVLGLLSLLASHAALAQEKKTSWESEFRFAMVGDSQFEDKSRHGDVDLMEFSARAVLSVKAREGVLGRFGLEFKRVNLGVPKSVRLPSKLQAASLVVGVDLQLGEAWLARVEVQPGFYSGQNDLRGDDFNIPLVVGASYIVSSDLQLVAGISLDLQRKYPVLPGLGLRWKFASDWVLNAILPAPRLEYSFNKSVLLYAGADLQEITYRMPSNFGSAHGTPKLNNAITDYTQIRVGGGLSWKIRPEATLEVEAGCAVMQDYDFHRADVRVKSTGTPPYGGVVLKFAF